MDQHTSTSEWVPGKISEVKKSCDNQVESFLIHVIVEREEEKGEWTDTYKPGLSACVCRFS